jgi:hypothetical protein
MKTFWIVLLVLLAGSAICAREDSSPAAPQTPKIETSYDPAKDRTTIRLAPVEFASEAGKYKHIYLSPHFSFPGRERTTPEIVDFELQTVVKGRLRTDLYVLFIIDGEKIHLSSSRWAVKRPVPGRVWIGERLVFRMPYDTFVKITKAASVEIKFDAVTFSLGETQRQALRDFLSHMDSPK